MSDQQNKQSSASFQEVNDELTRGLKLCHSLVADYRSKMSRRFNDNENNNAANDDNHVQKGESDRARGGIPGL